MAKRSGVTVWWIERGTGQLRSERFDSPPNNGSYEMEVDLKYATDPVDTTVIYDERAGNEQWQLDALKAKSQQMTKDVAEKAK